MTDTTKPVPCHWCGGGTTILSPAPCYVYCENAGCRAIGPNLDTPEAAITAWNSIARVWQPIETMTDADRDGREQLCRVGSLIRVCRPKLFEDDVWEYHRDDFNAPGKTWSMIPTHWQPLPAVPAPEAEAKP